MYDIKARVRGRIRQFGDNIDTDVITPAATLQLPIEEIKKRAFEPIVREFYKTVKDGDIIVAGKNFGCGSSREQAPIAIKATGIKCIIASSYARIFFRNAINIGLPIIEFANVDEINTEDELDIHSEKGIIRNLTTKNEFKIKKMPSFILEIISADGLVYFARNKILKKG